MRKHLKNYLLPHEGNDHKPHILREVSVIVLVLVAVGAFALSTLQGVVLLRNIDFLAAVLPDVLVDLTNEDRAENQLQLLTPDMTLQASAQLKANHMAENGYFAHVSPDGVSPWHWFIEAGYQFTHAGENLAVNFIDSEDVEQAWMDSPGHRANILSGNFTEIGIATAEGEYQGRRTVFVVQHFGSPAVVPTAPIQETPEVAGEMTEDEAGPETTTEEVVEVLEPVEEAVIQEENLEIIEETETFVAVRMEGAESVSDVEGSDASGLVPPQSTMFERFATQPHQLLQWLYIVFGAIMVIVLTVTIFVEIEKQHPRNVMYGILLLALLLVLMYVSRNVIFADLLIV